MRPHTPGVTRTPPPADPAADARSAQLDDWAHLVEVGVLARAAREDPAVPWRGDATEEELRWLEAAGVRARQQLVGTNLGLVGSVAARYAGSAAALADLFQEGCVGLIVAVERFDHRRGVRFSTYASYWIRACVSAAATRFAGAVSVPAHRGEQLRVARGVEGALVQHLAREPTVAEVAAVLGRGERWTAGLLAQRPSWSLEEVDDAALISIDSRGVDVRVRQGARVRSFTLNLATFSSQSLFLASDCDVSNAVAPGRETPSQRGRRCAGAARRAGEMLV